MDGEDLNVPPCLLEVPLSFLIFAFCDPQVVGKDAVKSTCHTMMLCKSGHNQMQRN